MTETKTTNTYREEVRQLLLSFLPPGTTVYTNLRHVSRSGMMRHLTVHFITRDGEMIDITSDVATVLNYRTTSDGYLKVQGAGVDMGFHVVYSLSRALYPDGHKCIGKSDMARTSCPSNDHSNDFGQARRDFFEQLSAEGGEQLLRGEDGYAEQHVAMLAYVDQRMTTDLGYRADRIHSVGGYALRHRWI